MNPSYLTVTCGEVDWRSGEIFNEPVLPYSNLRRRRLETGEAKKSLMNPSYLTVTGGEGDWRSGESFNEPFLVLLSVETENEALLTGVYNPDTNFINVYLYLSTFMQINVKTVSSVL